MAGNTVTDAYRGGHGADGWVVGIDVGEDGPAAAPEVIVSGFNRGVKSKLDHLATGGCLICSDLSCNVSQHIGLGHTNAQGQGRRSIGNHPCRGITVGFLFS